MLLLVHTAVQSQFFLGPLSPLVTSLSISLSLAHGSSFVVLRSFLFVSAVYYEVLRASKYICSQYLSLENHKH